MTPILSPKKTWEGAAGGLVAAMVTAIAIEALAITAALERNLFSAAGFGLVVGMVAMIGDLMESLIKRDCEKKDASQIVPGFGGVLDVLDSILFSAPLSYWWLQGISVQQTTPG
jgi:phosphatidate cytidylyltransferase